MPTAMRGRPRQRTPTYAPARIWPLLGSSRNRQAAARLAVRYTASSRSSELARGSSSYLGVLHHQIGLVGNIVNELVRTVSTQSHRSPKRRFASLRFTVP